MCISVIYIHIFVDVIGKQEFGSTNFGSELLTIAEGCVVAKSLLVKSDFSVRT
jgi:hypothetical protein